MKLFLLIKSIFSWCLGGQGGQREISRSRSAGSFFAGRPTFSNRPSFYVTYSLLSSGVVDVSCFRPSWKVSPIVDVLDRHTRCWSFDNLTTSFTYWRQCKDLLQFVPPRNSWYSVVCCLCYMLFLLYDLKYAFVYAHHTMNWWWDLGHSSAHC